MAIPSNPTMLLSGGASGGPVVTNGMTATQLVALLSNDMATDVKKALNYYDGKQKKEMEALLSSSTHGRHKWNNRGIFPRFRGITKMVVDKSGMLFTEAPPVLEVYKDGAVDPVQTAELCSRLEEANWQDYIANLDKTVRLVKTCITLVQYDADKQCTYFELLTRANSQIVTCPATGEIDLLIYVTYETSEQIGYRVITKEEYIDLVQSTNGVSVANRQPNPYWFVPAFVSYDTHAPRTGVWVEPGMDLVQFNEMYNLHLIDSEFSISWQKLPTAITNANLEDASLEQISVDNSVYNDKLGRASQASRFGKTSGGPGDVVQINTQGVDSPFFDYKGINVNHKELDEVVQGWAYQFACDWSVRLDVAGSASASSGFQLIVEEMPNLELRKLRQRMFEQMFKKMWCVLSKVVSYVDPTTSFDPESTVCGNFADPFLPVDTKDQEEVWQQRIDSGRATVLDYYMEVFGETRADAMQRYKETLQFNAMVPLLQAQATANAQAALTELEGNVTDVVSYEKPEVEYVEDDKEEDVQVDRDGDPVIVPDVDSLTIGATETQ